MKYFFLFALVFSFITCKKSENTHDDQLSKLQNNIDSINNSRSKYNDSIKILNDKNRFPDLTGSHKITFFSDGASMDGKMIFTRTGHDLYNVEGNAASGKNKLQIDGKIKRVSEKHLNFEGKIDQKINGSAYTRTKKTTFMDEGKGNFWRLQDKVNGDGFVDYIDIQK